MSDEAPTPSLASRAQRLAGFLVDAVFLGLITVTVIPELTKAFIRHPSRVDLLVAERSVTLAGLAVSIGIALYEIAAVAIWGRTVGKLVVGTRVVAANNLERPGWCRAALRWLPGLLAGLLGYFSFVVSLVVYGPLAIDPQHRGLHDRLAGTVVIRARDWSVRPSGASETAP